MKHLCSTYCSMCGKEQNFYVEKYGDFRIGQLCPKCIEESKENQDETTI